MWYVGLYRVLAIISVALPLAARAGVNVPPTVTCPKDIAVGSTTPTVVTYVASCSDDGGLSSFNCTPPSGSTFPVGTTTVTCVCTDTSGNVAACSFKVLVATPQGDPCTMDSECASDFCADGVCCNRACEEPNSCNLVGTVGFCTAPTPVPTLTSQMILAAALLLAAVGAAALRRRTSGATG